MTSPRTTNPPPGPPPAVPGHVIASAVVGSTAYGLAREGSDIDTLGVFVAPTLELCGLDWTSGQETVNRTGPDETYHEIGKYLRLALKCNPTILDLLWASPETFNRYGDQLVAIRSALIHEKGVRTAYGGYARAQVQRLAAEGRFADVSQAKMAKHGRHVLRLLRQGRELLTTGHMTLRVADPEEFWAFDGYTADRMVEIYEAEMALFVDADSVLPAAADRARVSTYLREVRGAY